MRPHVHSAHTSVHEGPHQGQNKWKRLLRPITMTPRCLVSTPERASNSQFRHRSTSAPASKSPRDWTNTLTPTVRRRRPHARSVRRQSLRRSVGRCLVAACDALGVGTPIPHLISRSRRVRVDVNAGCRAVCMCDVRVCVCE